ncbi:MAG: 4Fe-4S ferredoxin [Deltaproteobacteria bacterium CG_4_9_14_3_um_filter_51_14]|nr:4Fe-4S dicluster domain-containing protein [bacterium]OIP39066.1 MAG: 4Fe-4S ferredoxin [Desulfobacteraceae bacterium CG2_30_51_40]PJB34920.1 MAG: 4Fe-4S ferredoxin [Deltaproteobacteria bacterium CG_4_9_14_3_um_filter_51_14]
MGIDRRAFLKIAGLSTILGLGGKAAFDILAPGELEASTNAASPGAGKRWAMAIDARLVDDKVISEATSACHRHHNVPDLDSAKEEIKWIWEEDYEHSFPGHQHEFVSDDIKHAKFLLLCNHCSNPPCCRVCPTKATWQRADGIVMMDPHRCIGCRFCMAACPFGARSFNWGDPRRVTRVPELVAKNQGFPYNKDYPTRAKGVVEKCTFCVDLLEKGEQPLCMTAANKVKKGSFTFGDLSDPESPIRSLLRKRYSLRRKFELGTNPNVFYLI